jgi:hypothetical protein
MNSPRNVLWIVVGGIAFLCFVVLFALPIFHRDDSARFTPSSRTVSPSPSRDARSNNDQASRLIPSPDIGSNRSDREEVQLPSPPVFDNSAAEELHRNWVGDLDAKLRSQTIGLYGAVFEKLHLPGDLQKKVIDILTHEQRQLEQQALEGAQSGNVPSPPSPEAIRAQQVQQDQQLRSVLGEAGFAAFDQYRTSLPDRLTIDSMNQQGAALSESQSQQLLPVLTEARQQIMNPSAIGVDSMPPDQAMAAIQQHQVLLQQAVDNRVQKILTPEQATLLQHVMSRQIIPGP